jgi:diguanylate cyclase (GGDEF)-like protein
VFLGVSAASSARVAGVRLLGGETQVNLVPYLEILEDPTGALGLDDLSAVDAPGFAPSSGRDVLNMGYSHSAWWLRLNISSDRSGAYYLEVNYPSLDTVDFFWQDIEGQYQRLRGGDLTPFSERPLPHRSVLFPVDLTEGETVLYLRVVSEGSLIMPVTLWGRDAFHWRDRAAYAGEALYYGMLLALGLYNLLLFFNLRERTYLLYVLFLVGMAIGNASMGGLAGQFIWPEWPGWTHLALAIGMAMSGLFAAAFTRAFLDIPRTMPRLNGLFWFWILTFATLIPLSVLAYHWAEMLISLTSMGFCITALSVGVIGYRRGYAGARYFLLAWTILITGSFVLAARNFGWVSTNFWTSYGFQIGSALEMLLLSFALADRILVLRQQASTDTLTKLYNRRHITDLLNQELKRAGRRDAPFCLIMFDLDHFKSVNDNYGHDTGDRVLLNVAKTISERLRELDAFARWGGEEFLILARETKLEGAMALAETCRARLEQTEMEMVGRITVSIGVAQYVEGETIRELIHRADQALYAAKNAGRNRVMGAKTEPS